MIKILSDDFGKQFPNLERWIDAMMEQPAVKKNYTDPEDMTRFYKSYITGNPEYEF